MDRVIEKQTGWKAAFSKKNLKWWAAGAFAVVLVILIAGSGGSKLRIDGTTLMTGDDTPPQGQPEHQGSD